MSTPLCHRLLKTVACVCYFLPTLLLSQVIIREKVEIKPQPLPRSVQGALPIRVESSFDGSVDPNLPQLIWLNGPCAVDVASGNISGTLTAPAYDGAYKAGYRFTNPAGGIGGQFRFAVYLGDSLVREFRTPVSCPTGCTLFSEWDIRVYAGFTFSPQSAVIGSGGTNTFGAVESTSTVPCSPGMWIANWPIELEITKGRDVGSFVDGGKRSYTVAKKKSEFSTFGFLADGQKGYGDVEITARSAGITVVKGFKVVAPAPRVHIVPPWWWYGQPIKLSFDNLPILEFGETHTPGPGQKFEPVITWEPDDTINTADYFNLVNELYVKVKAENAGGVARDSVKLVFQTECIKVNFDPAELSPGDTARLSFQRVKEDGTLEDLPLGSYTFSVMIVGGEDSSKGLFITEEEEPEGGTTLLYASAPILYIAPPSIPDTLMKVQVIAAAWEVIWGRVVDVPRKGRVAIGLQSADDKREQTLKQAAVDSTIKRMRANVAETALKAISLSTWCPISQVVVKKSVNIKLEVGTTSLPPLGDDDNKDNPNYNRDGPDKRIKIKDSSKVRKTTATVTVTDADNKPVKDYSFTIKALVRANSGGHDHSEDRTTGRFVTEAKETLVAVQAKTESDGKKEFTYLSSGIGGIDSIFVKGTTDKDTASAVIALKLGDLEELTDGNHYDLVGEYGETDVTSRHRRNHYGKVDLIKKVKALADTIYADKKYKLRINDMSLQLGGPFDISNNWDTPHQKHRQGVSADIDDHVVKENGKSISITKDQLSFWLKKVSKDASIGDEGNHFHLTVK